MKKLKNKILFDLQCIQGENKFRGIGVFINSLLEEFILRYKDEFQFYFFLNGHYFDSVFEIKKKFITYLPIESFLVWYPCESVSEKAKKFNCLLKRNILKKINPDLVVVGDLFLGMNSNDEFLTYSIDEYYKFKKICIFYDLIPHLFPNWYLTDDNYSREYYRRLQTLHKFESILSISEQTSNDLNSFFKNKLNNKINTIGYGPSLDLIKTSPKSLNIKEKYQISSEKYIFYNGGGDPRKNIDNLIDAYLGLDLKTQARFNLVLSGRDPYIHIRNQRIYKTKPESFKNIRIIGFVETDDLSLLMKNCHLFIFPSLYEGAGLPLLEALHFDKLCIASDLQVFRDLVPRNFLFNPNDVKDIQKKIYFALSLNTQDIAGIGKTKKNVNDYTWQKVSYLLHKNIIRLVHKKKPLQPFTNDNNIDEFIKEIKSSNLLNNKELINFVKSIALNFKRSRKKRLYVDISELHFRNARTGIQRVTYNILKNIINLRQSQYDVIPVYALKSSNDYFYSSYLQNDLDDCSFDSPIHVQKGDIFFGLDLQHHVIFSKRNYFKMIHNLGAHVFFVVYDLIPLSYPHFWPPNIKIFESHRNWLDVVSKFDGLYAISKSVKSDLKTYLTKQNRDCYLDYFLMGSDMSFSSFVPKKMNKHLKTINFLMVGTLEPRKGHLDTIKAFDLLFNSGLKHINLTVVGKRGWLDDELFDFITSHKRFNKNLFYYDQVNDDKLAKLYHDSDCLIASSFAEGYGLPIIEAASYNLPVIARDLKVFKEVGKSSIFYSKMTSPDLFSKDIHRWLKLYSLNKIPDISKLKIHTWETCAKDLFKKLITRASK